jgi:hypothetical protein
MAPHPIILRLLLAKQHRPAFAISQLLRLQGAEHLDGLGR